MARYFDRYDEFRFNGAMKPIPGIVLGSANSDKSIVYKLGETRLDKISNLYYNNPFCGWLIMLANPQFGGLEFLIPDQTIITVPYPFESAIDRYLSEVNKYKQLYGG